MPRVFLAPYESPVLGAREDGSCAKPFSRLHTVMLKRLWPYDYGDDPAFFSREHHRANLTWGVCRPDVRTQCERDDVVVFFSFTNTGTGTDYHLCAVATVESKITHSDIFNNPRFEVFRKYLNLLVRPSHKSRSLWIHYEPGAPRKKWHNKDWVGRLTKYREYAKRDLEQVAKLPNIRVGSCIGRKPFQFGHNYVIFSQDPSLTAFIVSPPKVAHARPYEAERWCKDRFSRMIFEKTVGIAHAHGIRRSLRIENKAQHAHSPSARWNDTAESVSIWRASFLELLRREGLVI